MLFDSSDGPFNSVHNTPESEGNQTKTDEQYSRELLIALCDQNNPDDKRNEAGRAKKAPHVIVFSISSPADFFDGDYFFRSFTPGPSPFSGVKMTPADSRARRITSAVELRGWAAPASNWRTVTTPTFAASANCCWERSTRPRAARHWAGVIIYKR